MINVNKPMSFSCLILIVGLMAVDFISPSLPYIEIDFLTSQVVMKNTVLVYMIVLGIFQLPYGFLSDKYGRKLVIMIAFIVSIIGIGLSAFATDIYVFYLARIITAIGGAGCPVIARAIIADISSDANELKKHFSIFSLTSQISPSIAPILGGTIQIMTSWRVSLITLMFINIISFATIFKFMPETRKVIHDDITGSNIISILREYLELFRNVNFIMMSLLSALIYVYTIGFYNMLPFVLHTLHISVLSNGFINSFYACCLASGAYALHRYLHTHHSNKLFSNLTILLVIYFLLSTILFYFLNNASESSLFVTILVWGGVIGFLCGIIAPLTLSMCMQGFTKNKGIASSVQSSIKMFFTGVGLILFSQIELSNMFQISLLFLILTLTIISLWNFVKQV